EDLTALFIPKSMEWHFQLNNTRPILLLKCLQKLIIRVLNERLATIIRAPYGSGRIGSTALPDPKHRVGSGNGSKRVRMGQMGLKFDKSVILEYLDEYRSNRNDISVNRIVSKRRSQL